MRKDSESFPPLALLEMVTGYWVSQAVYVAAKLGIADLLEKEPRSCDELARDTGTHPDSLYRLMRALVSLRVFTAEEGNRFGLTSTGQCLQSNTAGSMRAMVLTLGEEHYQGLGAPSPQHPHWQAGIRACLRGHSLSVHGAKRGGGQDL